MPLTTYRMPLLPLLVLLVCVWRENQQTVIIHLGMDGSSIFRLLLWPFGHSGGIFLFKTSLGKVIHPEEVHFKWISVLILLISVGVKFWLSQFNKNWEAGSIQGNGSYRCRCHGRCNDYQCGYFLSLLALKYLNWNIDGVVGLAVSVAVMYGGLNIAKDTLAPLIGEAIDRRFMRRYLILWKDMKEYWEPMT